MMDIRGSDLVLQVVINSLLVLLVPVALSIWSTVVVLHRCGKARVSLWHGLSTCAVFGGIWCAYQTAPISYLWFTPLLIGFLQAMHMRKILKRVEPDSSKEGTLTRFSMNAIRVVVTIICVEMAVVAAFLGVAICLAFKDGDLAVGILFLMIAALLLVGSLWLWRRHRWGLWVAEVFVVAAALSMFLFTFAGTSALEDPESIYGAQTFKIWLGAILHQPLVVAFINIVLMAFLQWFRDCFFTQVQRGCPFDRQAARRRLRGYIGIVVLFGIVSGGIGAFWMKQQLSKLEPQGPYYVMTDESRAVITKRWAKIRQWAEFGSPCRSAPQRLIEAVAAARANKNEIRCLLAGKPANSAPKECNWDGTLPQLDFDRLPNVLKQAITDLVAWSKEHGELGSDLCRVRFSTAKAKVGGSTEHPKKEDGRVYDLVQFGALALAVATSDPADERVEAVLTLSSRLRKHGGLMPYMVGLALANKAMKTAQSRKWCATESFRKYAPKRSEVFPMLCRNAVCTVEWMESEMLTEFGANKDKDSIEKMMLKARQCRANLIEGQLPHRDDLDMLAKSVGAWPETQNRFVTQMFCEFVEVLGSRLQRAKLDIERYEQFLADKCNETADGSETIGKQGSRERHGDQHRR